MALASNVLSRQSNTSLLFFNSIPELTACASSTISWIYIGSNAPMTLEITNNGVTQLPAPTSSSSLITLTNGNGVTGRNVPTSPNQLSSNFTTITLSSNISPNASFFDWPQVTLHQGTYIATALIPAFQYTTHSLSFFVQESVDTSCLSTTSSTATATSSSTSPSSNPSTTAFPVRTASSVNKGAIVGGVVGGAVFLLGILALYLFFLRSRRSTHSPPSSYTRGTGAAFGMRRKGWGGLSSMDSNSAYPDGPKRKRSKLRSSRMYPDAGGVVHHQYHSDGPIVDGPAEEELQSSQAGHGLPPSSEKFSSSEEIVGMATFPVNVSRRQSSLTESSYNEFVSGGGATGTKRRTSVNSTVSLPPGARTRSTESSAPTAYTAPTTVQKLSSTSSPNVAAVAGMDRAASGTSSQQEKKKTPRKPVPAYVSSNPVAISNDPFISTPTSMFTPPSPFIDTEAQAQKRSSGHYGMSSRATGSDPQLNHKSSFGPGGVEGKPLHF